jgi:hypothetical protein
MVNFWIECSTRAFVGSWNSAIGLDNWWSVLKVILPLVAGLFIYWAKWGRTVTRSEYVRPMLVTAASYLIFFGIVFCYQFLKTPNMMREESRLQIESVRAENKQKMESVQKELEATRKTLRQNIIRLMTEKHRNELIKRLSQFRGEGRFIQLQGEGSQKLQEGETVRGRFEKWCGGIDEFFRKEFGDDYYTYHEWFENASEQNVTSCSGTTQDNLAICVHIEKRKRNLTEMIKYFRNNNRP